MSRGVPLDDRGLAYGDGVFETLLVQDGEPVWWDAHLARLQRGCQALGIDLPDPRRLQAQARRAARGRARAVLKLIVTRGSGGRGYAPPSQARTRVRWRLGDAPAPARTDARDGIDLRWCALRLADQPALAGLKHLNRLDNVLARAEWSSDEWAEGLLRAGDGRVVCATAANLFVLREGRWCTPALDRSGIAGTCRAWVMAHAAVTEVPDLQPAEVESAEALFVCNAVRGILPVRRLGTVAWPAVSPAVRALQAVLWAEVPALRPQGPIHD